MLLDQITERIDRIVNAGIMSVDSRFDVPYLINVINASRGELLRKMYLKDVRIHPQCYQKYYPAYEKDLQETPLCFVKFSVPNPIALDSQSDGLRYIGTVTGSEAFKRIQSRAVLSTYNNHRVMNVNAKRYISALYDGNNQIMEIYGDISMEEMLIEGLFANPLEVPTYNRQFDNYPLNDDLIPELEQVVLKTIVGIEKQQEADGVADANDNVQKTK